MYVSFVLLNIANKKSLLPDFYMDNNISKVSICFIVKSFMFYFIQLRQMGRKDFYLHSICDFLFC